FGHAASLVPAGRGNQIRPNLGTAEPGYAASSRDMGASAGWVATQPDPAVPVPAQVERGQTVDRLVGLVAEDLVRVVRLPGERGEVHSGRFLRLVAPVFTHAACSPGGE